MLPTEELRLRSSFVGAGFVDHFSDKIANLFPKPALTRIRSDGSLQMNNEQ
jgi:hypothetical protein